MFLTLFVNRVQASYQLRKTQKSWYTPLDFVQTLPSIAGWQLGLGDGHDRLIDSDVKDGRMEWNPYTAYTVNE